MPFPTNEPYFIGETAFHHQGSESDLLAIVDAVAEAGCHAVKFHLLVDLDDYMVKSHAAYDTIREWLHDADTWQRVMDHARQRGLETVLLCNDPAAVHMALERKWPARAFEVHATGVNDVLLLQAIAKASGTVVLGVGGCTLNEIQFALDALLQAGKRDVLLMHGFQNYPTDPRTIRLGRMLRLQDLFDVPSGYADHTDPNDPDHAVLAACASTMGIAVLEKHVTPWPGADRIDFEAAISVGTMQRIISLARMLWTMRGTDTLAFSPEEEKYGATGPMKKALVARRPVAAGTILSADDIAFKRTGKHELMRQREFTSLMGAKTLRAYAVDEPIAPEGVEVNPEPVSLGQFFSDKK
ncbi:MAG: N-acetylneuraminate synthase family protein [Flavobacteriales bacterium]